MKNLEEILSYNNNSIVYKFMEEYNVSYQESNDLFTQMLKWLWLCGKRKDDLGEPLFITPNMVIIDKMWHTFILFTRNYADFCNKHFGYFLHHSPTTKTEKDEMKKSMNEDKSSYMNIYKKKYREQLSYTYDNLGKDTVIKWENYGDIYSDKKIQELIINPVLQQ